MIIKIIDVWHKPTDAYARIRYYVEHFNKEAIIDIDKTKNKISKHEYAINYLKGQETIYKK